MSVLDINTECGFIPTAPDTDWDVKVYQVPDNMSFKKLLQIKDDIAGFIANHYNDINETTMVASVWEKYLKYIPVSDKYRKIIELGRDLLVDYLTRRFPTHKRITIKFESHVSGGNYVIIPTAYISIYGTPDDLLFYYTPKSCPCSKAENYQNDFREYKRSIDIIPEFNELHQIALRSKFRVSGDPVNDQLFDSCFINGKLQ